MSNQQENRSAILKQLFHQLQTWDGTAESANEIISQNKSLLFKLKEVDAALKTSYSDIEQKQVIEIITVQKNLLTIINQDRTAILDKMKQMNQKNKVVDNYYSSFQQSIFVDKGI